MAIQKLNGSDLLGQRITVDWAFIKPKPPGRGRRYVRNNDTYPCPQATPRFLYSCKIKSGSGLRVGLGEIPFASCSEFPDVAGDIIMHGGSALIPRPFSPQHCHTKTW